jgi:probable F420-dependent oxidoreductase
VAHDRRFRFGIQLSAAPDAASWSALARKSEDLGYSTLLVPDHFGDQLGPIPALMAAADATTTLRVGPLVFDNDFRHPVVLAKDVATVDLLSGGRFELGLGAGWLRTDYDASGIPFDPPGVRIDRMIEALAVMRGCFADGPFSFEGEHYRITDLDAQPLPAQRPHPPILIGGGGRRLLEFAAREADIVGINPALRSGQVDAAAAKDGVAALTDEKRKLVQDAAGERDDNIEINMLVLATVVTDDRAGTIETMAPMFGLAPDEVEAYPHACIGTVEQICDDLRARRERWDASYFVFQGEDALDAIAPVVAALAGT